MTEMQLMRWSRREITAELIGYILLMSMGAWSVFRYSRSVEDSIAGLSPGWIPGRQMDLYDHQWRSFRESAPLVALFMLAQSLVVRLTRRYASSQHGRVQLVTGLIFALVLHGSGVIFIGALAFGNFALTRVLSGRFLIASVWAYSLLSLVLVFWSGDDWKIPFTPHFSGMTAWACHFNFILLKMVSFGVDCARAKSASLPAPTLPPSATYKQRQESNLPLSEYSAAHYFGFIFYAPLFIAGPIMSFNAWQSQMRSEQQTVSLKSIGLYSVRWVACFFCLEVVLHFLYANGIAAQKGEALLRISSLSLSVYLTLYVFLFMWLKFLLIWRFFRLWSLLNGIDAPENMTRCVYDNYSVAQFWKSWHASFNVWLIRYVYVPLGGSKSTFPGSRLINILIVFTFVALWHDLTWRVFHWAWMVTGIFAPELIGTHLWRKSKFFNNLKHTKPATAKLLKISAAMFNILLLMSSNMVGYVFGVEGLTSLLGNVFSGIGGNIFSVLWDILNVLVMLYCMANVVLFHDELRAVTHRERVHEKIDAVKE